MGIKCTRFGTSWFSTPLKLNGQETNAVFTLHGIVTGQNVAKRSHFVTIAKPDRNRFGEKLSTALRLSQSDHVIATFIAFVDGFASESYTSGKSGERHNSFLMLLLTCQNIMELINHPVLYFPSHHCCYAASAAIGIRSSSVAEPLRISSRRRHNRWLLPTHRKATER